jgi:hypothetical protein
MEALYHGTPMNTIPCARNRADARRFLDDNSVLVGLHNTERTMCWCALPISDYVRRHIWTNSRLRGR